MYHRRLESLFSSSVFGSLLFKEFCNCGFSLLKGGDRRVRIFSAHNNWGATPEVSSPLPYQRSAKVFPNLLRQGLKAMYYFKNVHLK